MFATAVRIERDLGVPFVSLNALTGHRSCAPEDCGRQVSNPPQGPVPVSGVFPAGAALHLLETRLQAITLSPYHADLPARHPVRLGVSCRFTGMLFSHVSFRTQVSHQIQRQSPLVPARCAGDTTVRLMAHRPLRTLRSETKGQAGACPDRTRAIPCKVRVACSRTACAELTATVTATAATNGKRQRPATAQVTRTIRSNLAHVRPEQRKVGR
jgi:hypothetical protein